MKDACFVICGLDTHLERVEYCISTIKHVYGDRVDIGLSTFGNVTIAPSNKLKAHAKKHDYYFYDAPRQDFFPLEREWHSCEILGMFAISKYFYDLGFKYVYLLHSDIFVVRDFLSYYESLMIDPWSFICPFITIRGDKISYQEALRYNSFTIYKRRIQARLTQSIIVFNKRFILEMYDEYKDERQMWDKVFEKSCMFGDIGLFDIAENFRGYSARPLDAKYTIDGDWEESKIINRIIQDKNVCFIHGPKKFKFLKKKIKDVLNRI